MVKINKSVSIPDDELIITASRSSGPGGQNVNKVSTKVTLKFNVNKTNYLSAGQKSRVLNKLRNIINKDGFIVMHEETSRTQAANRRRAIKKFAAVIAQALKVPKKRVPTKMSRAQKEKRLKEKKIHAMKKAGRLRPKDME
jgi:ribosome-associated protein